MTMEDSRPKSEDAKRAKMFDDLKEQYSIIAQRRSTLTGQASSLLGFAGIIETILIAAVVALATDGDVRNLINNSQYRYFVIVLAGIGFFSYIATAVFSLRAYYEPKWIPAPYFPPRRNRPLQDSVDNYWEDHPLKYSRKDTARQYALGINYNQGVNNSKYDNQ
jgi:hypothetical protein